MKKIVIVFLLILTCCTGCFDHQELNDLAIVSALGIDYEDEEFKVTFEILNDKKGESNDSRISEVYIATGSGITLVEAMHQATLQVKKSPYFMHLKVLVLGDNLIKTKFRETIDYLLRSPKLSHEFLSAVAKKSTAYDILTTVDDADPIISNTLVKMIENSDLTSNVAVVNTFEDLLGVFLSPGEDPVVTAFSKEDDVITIDGLAAFRGLELEDYLSISDSITYNVLTNNGKNAIYKSKCKDNNDYISANVYNSKVKYQLKNDKIIIESTLELIISENNCNYDLLDRHTFPELDQEFSKVIDESIDKLITRSKAINSDFLGFGSIYYKKKRSEIGCDWTNLDYELKTNIKINRKGLIYEVEYDN